VRRPRALAGRGPKYIFGLIVIFTIVIYVISGFHPCKNFGLPCVLVKKKSGKPPSSI